MSKKQRSKASTNLTIHEKVKGWLLAMAEARGQSPTSFVEELIRNEYVRLFGPIRPNTPAPDPEKTERDQVESEAQEILHTPKPV